MCMCTYTTIMTSIDIITTLYNLTLSRLAIIALQLASERLPNSNIVVVICIKQTLY